MVSENMRKMYTASGIRKTGLNEAINRTCISFLVESLMSPVCSSQLSIVS